MKSQCFSVGTQISGALGDENSLTSEHRTDLGVLQSAGVSRGNYSTAGISNDDESVFSANDEVQGSFIQTLPRRSVTHRQNSNQLQVGPSSRRQNSVQMSNVDRQKSDNLLETSNIRKFKEQRDMLKQRLQDIIVRRCVSTAQNPGTTKSVADNVQPKAEDSVEAKMETKVAGDSREVSKRSRINQSINQGSQSDTNKTPKKRKFNFESRHLKEDQQSNLSPRVAAPRSHSSKDQMVEVGGQNQEAVDQLVRDENEDSQSQGDKSYLDGSLSVRGQIYNQLGVGDNKLDNHGAGSRQSSLNFGQHTSRNNGAEAQNEVMGNHGTKVLFGIQNQVQGNWEERPARDPRSSYSLQFQGQNYQASKEPQPAQSMAGERRPSPSESSKVEDHQLEHQTLDNAIKQETVTPFYLPPLRRTQDGPAVLRMQESQKAVVIRESNSQLSDVNFIQRQSVQDEHQFPQVQDGRSPNDFADVPRSVSYGEQTGGRQRQLQSARNSCASGGASQDDTNEDIGGEEEAHVQQKGYVQMQRNNSTYAALQGSNPLKRQYPSDNETINRPLVISKRFRSSVDENMFMIPDEGTQQQQSQMQGSIRSQKEAAQRHEEQSNTSILGEINTDNNAQESQPIVVTSQNEAQGAPGDAQGVSNLENYVTEYNTLRRMHQILHLGSIQVSNGGTGIREAVNRGVQNVLNYLLSQGVELQEVINFVVMSQNLEWNRGGQDAAVFGDRNVLQQGIKMVSRLIREAQHDQNLQALLAQSVDTGRQGATDLQMPQQAVQFDTLETHGQSSVNDSVNDQQPDQDGNQDQGSIVVQEVDQMHYMAGPSNYVQQPQESMTQNSNLPEED